MNPGIQRDRCASQCFETHGGGSDRGAPEDIAVVNQQGQKSGLGLGPVNERQSLLGSEPIGRQASSLERFPRGKRPPLG